MMSENTAHPATQWTAVITLAIATLVIASELSLTAFALPLIGREFDVAEDVTAWILIAYTIPIAALAISAGDWVDGADLRAVYVFSLSGVAFASVLTYFASSFAMLVAGRALQGVFAALFLAVYLPVVANAVPDGQRGRAMSYIATIMMVGSVALAPLGGFVAEQFGWREVFLIKVPLLVPVLWLGARYIPRQGFRARTTTGLPMPDVLMLREAVIIGVAVTAVMIAITFAATKPSWGIVLTAVALGASWLWVRSPRARQTTTLLGRPALGMPMLALLLMSAVFGLITFSLPYFVSAVMARGPQLLSVAMLFFIVPVSVVSPVAGLLADRYGPLKVACVGGAIATAGMLSMFSLQATAQMIDLGWRTAAVGIGMALFNSPNMTVILQAAPSDRMGAAGGLTNLARTMGNTIGPAVASLAWSLSATPIVGYRAGALVLSGCTLSALLALVYARWREPFD